MLYYLYIDHTSFFLCLADFLFAHIPVLSCVSLPRQSAASQCWTPATEVKYGKSVTLPYTHKHQNLNFSPLSLEKYRTISTSIILASTTNKQIKRNRRSKNQNSAAETAILLAFSSASSLMNLDHFCWTCLDISTSFMASIISANGGEIYKAIAKYLWL